MTRGVELERWFWCRFSWLFVSFHLKPKPMLSCWKMYKVSTSLTLAFSIFFPSPLFDYQKNFVAPQFFPPPPWPCRQGCTTRCSDTDVPLCWLLRGKAWHSGYILWVPPGGMCCSLLYPQSLNSLPSRLVKQKAPLLYDPLDFHLKIYSKTRKRKNLPSLFFQGQICSEVGHR